jgi:hypothetical protein
MIHKGRTFAQSLIFDGSDIVLDFHFLEEWDENPPLVTIVLNGRVIWEDYLNDSVLSISFETKEGENNIQMTAVNRNVTLNQIIWKLNNIM